MKHRFWIVLAISGLIVAVVWLFYIAAIIPRETSSRNEPRTNTILQSSTNGSQSNQLIQKGFTQNIVRKIPLLGRAAGVQASVDSQNVPIAFFGKVVDQDGKSLGGARVQISVQQWYMTVTLGPNAKNLKSVLTTASDGVFSVSNAKGEILTIDEISKEGYELSSKAIRAFNYTRGSVANPTNPVVFKMWKMNPPEQLAKYDKIMRIPYDGTVVTFDLANGTKSTAAEATGDLRITLIRNPLRIELGRREKYDWIATVEAVNGGLVESDDEFMYRAPESGYSPKLDINMSASAPNWSRDKSITFYFKSRGGQCYGRAKIELRTGSDQPTTGCTVKSAMNCSGSRSLE